MEWTREKTLVLISEYRKRRELWDMTHDDYRKKEMKQRYLLEVSKSLGGISISEIEKKFHTLRTQFHREINRMKRKESYNSKWFGFKQLQFLSSPKACRSSKGRIKSEITEEGTVTSKYIISEHAPDNSTVSVNSSNSTIPDEFLTIHRKPSNVTYETADSRGNGAASQSTSTATSRSQELEKLIEETTKDVEYIEDAKPKLTIKEIRTPMETQAYEAAAPEMETETHEAQMQHEHEPEAEQHHHQGQQAISTENVNPLAIEIQSADGEIITNHYHQTGNAQTTTIHSLPRIIKIQRRDTISGHDDDYYHHQHSTHQEETHILPHEIPQATKRIYYGANGQHTTILTPTTQSSHQSNGNNLMPATTQHRSSIIPLSQTQSPTSSPQQQAQAIARDEFATYGEYVANEMRNLTNRETLVALKHKINNALFEASMSELQK